MAVIAAVLLALFLFRPGLSGMRRRIARSIGSSLGRRVTLENVRAHLLPRPGFDLEGLVIYDDPAFSAEPMVRAQEVSAVIRISSVFRGRLEISTLSATEPSINLVRNHDGHWNLEGLLERTAQTPVAPTDKPASERRPAFPYLEASRARINFKLGQEKKSYSLTDADVALWQDSENSWATRITAQPIRTDFNLTDTGRIRFNATWRRAARLGETPVQAALRWDGGQLGQITKLLSGRDRGWRGGVSLAADISGTPEALLVHSQIAIADFHRFDISDGQNIRLATTCSGRYSTADRIVRDLACESPVGVGEVRIQGSVGPISEAPAYALKVTIHRVPVPAALRLVRETKKTLPADLVATGQLDAQFEAQHSVTGTSVSGEGSIADLRMAINGGKDEISFGDVPIALVNGIPKTPFSPKPKPRSLDSEPHGAQLHIGPFPLGMGASKPATAGGWLSPAGYRLSLRGDTDLKHIFRLASVLGIPGDRPVVEGTAHADVALAGSWQGFAPPGLAGTLQLVKVRAGMRGLNTPIEIASASLVLDSDSVTVRAVSATTGSTHWSGSVTIPRHCTGPDCAARFDLAADQLSATDLVEWLNPRQAKRPWYRTLGGPEQGPSPLRSLRAGGNLQVGRFAFKKSAATHLSARVELNAAKISLIGLQAQIFDGKVRGDWTIDASSQPLRYEATGTLQAFSLGEASALTNDGWITGTADGQYAFTSPGATITELAGHAEGELQFSMQNGTLKNVSLPGGIKPFPVHRFSGTLTAKKGSWTLRSGKLESRDGIYQVSGSVSPSGVLDLVFVRGDDQKWKLSGTLSKPRATPANRTEARTAVKP